MRKNVVVHGPRVGVFRRDVWGAPLVFAAFFADGVVLRVCVRAAMHHTFFLDPMYVPKQPPAPRPAPVLQDFGGSLDGPADVKANRSSWSLASRIAHRRQQRRTVNPEPLPYTKAIAQWRPAQTPQMSYRPAAASPSSLQTPYDWQQQQQQQQQVQQQQQQQLQQQQQAAQEQHMMQQQQVQQQQQQQQQ
jgi:hypothetical protein